MKQAILFLALTFFANAQAPTGEAPKPNNTPGIKNVDPQLHDDAIKLVEISGVKERIQGGLPQMVEAGKKQMMENCQACTPAFVDEWGKRMLERTNVNDFVDVYVRVYEKYFTDAEISELIALRKASKQSQTTGPSPLLKQKLASVMPSVMADTLGGCAQVGAKLGAEIGDEIGREHPEYMRKPDRLGKQ